MGHDIRDRIDYDDLERFRKGIDVPGQSGEGFFRVQLLGGNLERVDAEAVYQEVVGHIQTKRCHLYEEALNGVLRSVIRGRRVRK